MKLLLVHRYIRPDTPGYAHMLYIMGQHFAKQGHEVTIFSAQPSYNDAYDGPSLPKVQQVDGMTVIRTPLFKETKKNALMRSLNFLRFSMALFCHAVFRRQAYDLMTVTTFPPAIMGFLARMIGCFRKTKYVYHCMDLYPEVAETSGVIKRKFLLSLARSVDKRNCQKAGAVVLLSDDMRRTIAKRGIATDNTHSINNFIIDHYDSSLQLPTEIEIAPNEFHVIFAGNMGRFQSLDTIVAAAKIIAEKNSGVEPAIKFLFVGAGTETEALKSLSGDLLNKSIFFHSYYPIQTALTIISRCQLGVISLGAGVIECAYPSKTMTYLEAGCKLLTLVEPESALARMVVEKQLGQVCAAATPEAVADAILVEYKSWQGNGSDPEHVRKVGRSLFDQSLILSKWDNLLAEMDSEVSC